MQFNLSYGEVTPLDYNFRKKHIQDDIQYISESSEINSVKKVHGGVSISYDCVGLRYPDYSRESFIFSIGNDRHTVPLPLDSSPSFLLDPNIHSVDIQSVSADSSEVLLLSDGNSNISHDAEITDDMSSGDHLQRALIAMPSMQVVEGNSSNKFSWMKNKRRRPHSEVKNDSDNRDTLYTDIGFQCDNRDELFEMLRFDIETCPREVAESKLELHQNRKSAVEGFSPLISLTQEAILTVCVCIILTVVVFWFCTVGTHARSSPEQLPTAPLSEGNSSLKNIS